LKQLLQTKNRQRRQTLRLVGSLQTAAKKYRKKDKARLISQHIETEALIDSHLLAGHGSLVIRKEGASLTERVTQITQTNNQDELDGRKVDHQECENQQITCTSTGSTGNLLVFTFLVICFSRQ